MRETKTSENISAFLDFLREAQLEYKIALSRQNDASDMTQDILHTLELENVTYHDCAKLSKAMKEIRQERRKAKDECQVLIPVAEWANNNAKTIKELERLLGDVRKAERATEGRFYNQKTDIIKKTIGSVNKNGES